MTRHRRRQRHGHVVGCVHARPGGFAAGTGVAGFGGDGLPAVQAQLNLPSGVAVDRAGNVLVADTLNDRVRRVDAITGTITTVAGSGTPGFSGDGGNATAAQLNAPAGLAVDRAGNLYIADSFNRRIRKVTPEGGISTVVGEGSPAPVSLLTPAGITIASPAANCAISPSYA